MPVCVRDGGVIWVIGVDGVDLIMYFHQCKVEGLFVEVCCTAARSEVY